MSKLYLLRSNHEKDNSGDVIINLDKVLAIRLFKRGDNYLLKLEYTHEDCVNAIFDSLDKARNVLSDIVNNMGGHASIAENINPMEPRKKEGSNDVIADIIKTAILKSM